MSSESPSWEWAPGRPGGSRSTESASSHVDTPPPSQRDASLAFPNRLTALQVHNTYLIYETDEGMVVIDQHALHERIIYEQLRERVLGGKLETQRLLVPEPVTLLPAESAAVRENAEVLEQLGMAIEPFGGDTVLVVAYPALLANQNLSEMLRGIVQLLMAESHRLDRRDLVDEILHMISCKAAVKAGDKLTPEEIQALLEHREYCQDSHHCPHGRPTALVFSRQELDRRFKRI
jgi:DNA mismatch repair protein MutL